MKKLLLPIILGAIALASTSALVAVLLTQSAPTAEAEAEVEAEAVEVAEPIYHALEPDFTVNFHGKQRPRMMQVSFTAMTRDPEVPNLIEQHSPAIRNNLIMTLSGLKSEELLTDDGKETMRQTVLSTVQDTLKEHSAGEGVEDIYVTKLIMQ